MKVSDFMRPLAVLVLLTIAVISFLPIAAWTASPETYQATIASIDEKTDTVLKLTATSTLASAAISAIPDDTATPIAEKLADFTEYFMLILCTLYAEKYLLTIIGMGTFRILIPVACLLCIYGLISRHTAAKRLAMKLGLVGLALFLAIPASIQISDMVFDTYQESINTTIASAQSFSQETAAAAAPKTEEGLLSAIVGVLSDTASSISNRAVNMMNNFIESLAVMIVTSCVIPVVVLFFFLWLVKALTGYSLAPPRHRKTREAE